nr:MAG TPA: hypothetical protein [Caudoviricetes sp.]
MIINNNLAVNTFDNGVTASEKEDGYQYILVADFKKIELVDRETYTVSFNISQTKNGSGKYNAGPLSIPTPDKPEKYLMDRTSYVINSRSSFSFTYNKNTQSGIAVYTDLVLLRNGTGATIKNLKIERGDAATPYLPNKNSLTPSKQAIFKAGGVFEDIYPI